MLKRILMFTTPVYLSLRNQQLVLTFKEDPEKSTTIPIEDVGMVILEHQQAIATLPALNALTEGGRAGGVVQCKRHAFIFASEFHWQQPSRRDIASSALMRRGAEEAVVEADN